MVPENSRSGGGSLPLADIPTWAVSVASPRLGPDELEEKLRLSEPPVLVRIRDERVLLDPRTLLPQDYEDIPRLFAAIASPGE